MNVTYEMLVGLAIVIAIIASALFAAFRAGTIKGANDQLKTVREDLPTLDRAEQSIGKTFTAEQLDVFRQVIFPIFALGLAITPQGDINEAIARSKDLTDVLTDRKPNVLPSPAIPGQPGFDA